MALISEVTGEIVPVNVSVIQFFWKLVVRDFWSGIISLLEILGLCKSFSKFFIAWCSEGFLVIDNIFRSFDVDIVYLG